MTTRTYLYAITAAGTKKIYGRANYNIDRNTRIGDSSLYARNDEGCNATDYEGRGGKNSDTGRANYNIHRNTRIGDSSLYARNDEYYNNVTAKKIYITNY
jgi:hypothetical protein